MPYSPNYPKTVAEVLDPPVRFQPAVITAVKRFAKAGDVALAASREMRSGCVKRKNIASTSRSC